MFEYIDLKYNLKVEDQLLFATYLKDADLKADGC